MILSRLGNKTKVMPKILEHFPHRETISMYVSMFFGAGGDFFNLDFKPKYAVLNDLDGNVFNLWEVVRTNPDALVDEIERLPACQHLWKAYEGKEIEEPILKAALFLFFSNFAYMCGGTMKVGPVNIKQQILSGIDKIQKDLGKSGVSITNKDFRQLLSSVGYNDAILEKPKTFIYADPPYLSTANNYESGFKEQDTRDLLEVLVNSGIRFAMSEFQNPVVMEMAEAHKLNIITIGERRSMKNRSTEILITNYKNQPTLFCGLLEKP